MLMIKVLHPGTENYQVYCATNYQVARPVDPDPSTVPADVEKRDPLYPTVSATVPDGSHVEIAVRGEVYIENIHGKTVDTIRPRFPRGLAK